MAIIRAATRNFHYVTGTPADQFLPTSCGRRVCLTPSLDHPGAFDTDQLLVAVLAENLFAIAVAISPFVAAVAVHVPAYGIAQAAAREPAPSMVEHCALCGPNMAVV